MQEVKALARLCICAGLSEPRLLAGVISTVKPVSSSYSKIDKTNILMANGSLMKVKSIAQCSKGSILQYF